MLSEKSCQQPRPPGTYVEENLEEEDLDLSEEELRELYEAQQPGEMEQPMEIEIEGE